MIELTLAPGLQVRPLPQRALYWPAEATLFVADMHVGKADVFQVSGIPVPGAISGADLARLSTLLTSTRAQRLVILGDFFHAAASQSAQMLAMLEVWRRTHARVEILLVTGNHDLHAGPPPADLAIVACGEAVRIGPFHCVHAPELDPPNYTLCGHMHPVALLAERTGGRYGARSARLPCFHVGVRQMVLPAFSTFTGGKGIVCRPGDRIIVTTGDEIFEAAIG